MKKTVGLLALLAVVWGCQSEPKEKSYVWERVDSVRTTLFKADSMPVINSFGFALHQDALLMEDIANNEKRVVAFRVKGDSIVGYTRFLGVGRGPDEATSSHLYPCDDFLLMSTNYNWVSVMGLYQIFDLDRIADPKSYQKVPVPESNEIWHIAPIDSDNYLVTFAGFEHKAMFGVLNVPSQSIRELNVDYPGEHQGVASNLLAPIYIGTLAKRPHQQEYVYSTQEGNCVFTFRMEEGQAVGFKELYNAYPQYTLMDNGRKYKVVRENKIYGYGVVATDQFIYLLGRSEDQMLGNTVEVFDWDGTPVRKIVLDRRVIHVVVAPDDSKLYAQSETAEGELELFYASI